MFGGDGGEVGTVGGFLQADELFEAFAFVGNLEREPVEGFHVAVRQIAHHAAVLVEDAPQTAQQQFVAPLLLPVPGIDEHRAGAGPEPLAEPPPDPGGVGGIGRDLVHALREQRFRIPRSDQAVGERVQRIGVEKGREQPLESFVVAKDQHRQKRVSCPVSVSRLRLLGAVSRRRTSWGVSSFTVAADGSSRQVTKYWAFFITTPICRSAAAVRLR